MGSHYPVQEASLVSLELLPGKHPLQAFSHTSRLVTGFIRIWPACPTANRLSQTWLPEAGSVYLWLIWIWSSDPLSFTLQGVPGHSWRLAALAWQKPLKTSPAREMEAGFSHTYPHSRDRAPQHPRPPHWDWAFHLQAEKEENPQVTHTRSLSKLAGCKSVLMVTWEAIWKGMIISASGRFTKREHCQEKKHKFSFTNKFLAQTNRTKIFS